MNLGQQIMIGRKNLCLTQKELSDRIGISTTQISNIENETSNPKIETLKKISKVLNIDFIVGW
jgi:transcriptional regulator with XRE-family HTH domain